MSWSKGGVSLFMTPAATMHSVPFIDVSLFQSEEALLQSIVQIVMNNNLKMRASTATHDKAGS